MNVAAPLYQGLKNLDLQAAKWLAALIRELNTKSHNPATSGNYSFRSTEHVGAVWVSESGIDKSLFTENNFLLVDQVSGKLLGEFTESGRKSSDETGLHLAIYQNTQAGCVLHSHILESLLFADLYPQNQPVIEVSGLELLKGFKGVRTHEAKVVIPCFDNSQDIPALAQDVGAILAEQTSAYGFLLRGHGLYVWGASVADAKRHLEVFEYIFRYFLSSARRA